MARVQAVPSFEESNSEERDDGLGQPGAGLWDQGQGTGESWEWRKGGIWTGPGRRDNGEGGFSSGPAARRRAAGHQRWREEMEIENLNFAVLL
jgi:hypothetical protein